MIAVFAATVLRTMGALALALTAGTAVAGAETIRVSIAADQRSVELRSSAGLVAEGGKQQGKSMSLRPASVGRAPLRVHGRGGAVTVGGHAYRGIVEVRRKSNGRLQVINELDLEEYLKGVVAAEVPSDWEMEALKAQAVASRTYAIHQKRANGRRPFHIENTVNGQVYLGRRGERPRAVRAVEATKGQVVLYEGRVIAAFYHSSCGGRTEDASALWGIEAPYLRGVDCDCQQISTYGLWEKRFSAAEVLAALRREGYRMSVIDEVEGGSITPGGRMREVRFRHPGGLLSVPSESLRAALGYSRVPSIFFEPELAEREVVLSGRGLGHGVGLCQWGAEELARKGYTYQRILQHYYPGTVLGRI